MKQITISDEFYNKIIDEINNSFDWKRDRSCSQGEDIEIEAQRDELIDGIQNNTISIDLKKIMEGK